MAPTQEDGVIALAVIDSEKEAPKIVETLLLHITFSEGKAHIDLRTNWAGFSHAMGQLVTDGKKCGMRLFVKDGSTRHATPWTIDALSNQIAVPLPEQNEFDEFCKIMVKGEQLTPSPVSVSQN